jgi:hypothetical protein
MQHVDGLPWLACPRSPPPDTQTLLPSSAHSSFDSIAGKIKAYNKHTCIHKSQAFYHPTSHNQRVSETNMFRI